MFSNIDINKYRDIFRESDFKIFELINKLSKTGSKNCARNAIYNLCKAWDIKDMDYEMSVFRSLNGEEEAITSIILALRENGYEKAKRINCKRHDIKNMGIGLIHAIGERFKEFNLDYKVDFDNSEKPQGLTLVLNLENLIGINKIAYTNPPLNFSIKINNKNIDLHKSYDKIVKDYGYQNIEKYVSERSRLRNRVLYATEKGIPNVQGNLGRFLKDRFKQVINLLIIYLLIKPYHKKQIFVQDILNNFINILRIQKEKNEKYETSS